MNLTTDTTRSEKIKPSTLNFKRFAHPLLKLVFIGLMSQLIYVTYIVAFPLISNTRLGGPAADLEILMRDYHWFAPVYTAGLLLLYYLFWQAMKTVADLTGQRAGLKYREVESSPQAAGQAASDPLQSPPVSAFKLLIVAFGLLFGFTLVWLYPITANDLFRYVLRARIWTVYGESPMLVPPNAFPNDPYLPFAGEFGEWVSGYGALWEIVAQLPLRLGATGMVSGSISLKLVVLLCYLACAILLGWFITPQKGSSLTALTFFAWNPLILMQGPGNGHNDMLFMVLLVLGLLFWQRKIWWATTLALALATVAKAPAILILPLFGVVLWRDEPDWRRSLVKATGAALLGLITIYLVYSILGPLNEIFQDVWNVLTGRLEVVFSASPILSRGWLRLTRFLGFAPPSVDTPPGLGAMLTTRRGFAIASELRMVLREFLAWDVAETVPRTTGRYIFILFYLWLLVALWRKKLDLVTAGFLAYFSQLMLGRTFRIWYPMWLVPLAAIHLTPATFWRTILFCLTAELSIINYFVVWRWWLKDLPWERFDFATPNAYWPVMHTLTVPWLFGIPLFGPILMKWWSRNRKP